MSARARTIVAAAAVAVIAAVLIALLARPGERSGGVPASGPAASGQAAGAFAGAALPGDVRAPDFTLTDQSGQQVSLARPSGRVTVLAFMSTSCTPACVLVAHQIRGALDELARAPRVLLVSVDPAADTPARVRGFLSRVSLTGRVQFLSGPAATLRAIWRAYGVRPISSGRVAFERSAEVRLIDRSGHERVIFGLEQLTPEGLARDIGRLS